MKDSSSDWRSFRGARQTALQSATLGAVLKTALDAVVVMRMDGTIAGWNDVAERTFGWTLDEADGKRMSELLIPVRYRAAHENGLMQFLATGEGPVLNKHIEIEALHRDGRELPIELSITRTSQFGEPVFLGFLRDISERRDAARLQNLMIGELNHRVKNLLGVVSGIAHMTGRSSRSLEEFQSAFSGRLMALGKAHEILTEATWQKASLRKLADEAFGIVADDQGTQILVRGPEVLLSPRHLLSVSMIFHELFTNAVKYGALSSPEGRVVLEWDVNGSELAIAWTESGMSSVSAPTSSGFGSKMLAMSVSHELRGTFETDWRETGIAFRFRFMIE